MANIKNPVTLIGGARNLQNKTVTPTASGFTVQPDTGYDALGSVAVNGDDNLVAGNVKKDVAIFGVTGSYTGSMPTLRTVTISRSGSTLTISNPSSNGTFVTGYKIYSNGTLIASQVSTTFNLDTLDAGVHSITVRAYGTNFNDSNASSAVSYAICSISNVLTDLTTSNTAVKIGMTQGYTSTLTAISGKYIPDSITITMGGQPAVFAYNNLTGVISITSVTGDVVITAVATDQPKLDAPITDLTGAILSWTTVANATAYSIRCAGEEVAVSTGSSIDLTALFPNGGAYVMTVVATASGYRESNASNSETYLVDVAPIYGVSGMYASAVALTRTDDAVGKTFAINSSSGAISSDFNDLFPWNEATVETINGNKFIHMPDMWFRVGKDTSNRITDVAVSKQQGATGNWFKVDSFYYSCYGGSLSNRKLASVSGVARLHTETRAIFRNYAAANGSGYFQEDLYHRTVMLFLWWIEWATKDSSSIMTGRIRDSGTSGGKSACNTGGTDSVSTPSGHNTSTAQMRYHYIEDFVGNYFEFVDGSVGTSSSGGVQYVTADPAYFGDTSANHNSLAFNSPTTSGSCLAAMGWDDNNPFLCLPKETVSNNSYNTYFCDYAATSNRTVLYCGAYWSDFVAYTGVSNFDRTDISTSFNIAGGRLLYKP